MFVYFGDNLINAHLIRSVRTTSDGKVMRADVTFSDGTIANLPCSLDVIEDLEDQLLKAPPGYKAVACFPDDDGKMAVIQQDIIAFRYKGADSDLYPITPYMMKDSAILCPSGQVATRGAIFNNLSEYLRDKEASLRA